MSWLAVRLLLSGALKRLASLNIWQLLCIALALFGAVQTIRVKAEQRHARKVEQQLSAAITKLNSISSARNDQAQKTTETIKIVTRTIHDAEDRARKIEQAPPAPDCRTKPEVMNADI